MNIVVLLPKDVYLLKIVSTLLPMICFILLSEEEEGCNVVNYSCDYHVIGTKIIKELVYNNICILKYIINHKVDKVN